MMKRNARRQAMATCVGVCVASLGMVLQACSSQPKSGGSNGSSNAASSCTDNALTVLFSPMYSAYDGTHQFQVPAIVTGVKSSSVTWSVSDNSVAAFAPDSQTGGIMITMLKAGTVTVTASAGSLCGSSVLTITQATTDDWELGNARYNDGVVLRRIGGRLSNADAGAKEAACTNCHGPTANGPFKNVAHTPEQTGGFSDDELVNIFTKGEIPDGGYFDPAIVPFDRWHDFHQWNMTPEQAKGIIVYLRSLTPTPQQGSSNFGGRGPRPDGGFRPMDGGPDPVSQNTPDGGGPVSQNIPDGGG